jgi:hypothetical protein
MDRNDKIMSMFDAGATYNEIAKYLGITRNAVAGVICRNRKTAPSQKKASARGKTVFFAGKKYNSIVEASRATGWKQQDMSYYSDKPVP